MPNTSARPHQPDGKDRSARLQEQEFKRARGAISCAECRRLKLKCDKTVPCSSCKRRGCSSICPNGSLTTGQGTRFILADTDRLHRKIAEMSDRIRQLEDALAILQSSITRDTHPLLNRDLLRIKSGLELHSAAHGLFRESEGQEDEEDDEEAQYIDAFGTLAVRDDGAATFYGRSAGSESLLLDDKSEQATSAPEKSNSRSMLPPVLTRLTTSFPSAPSDLPVVDLLELVEEHLPPWPRAAQLCDLYLEQAPWFFGAVTRRQLVEEVLPLFYAEALGSIANGSGSLAAGASLSGAAAAFNLAEARSGADANKGSSHDLALLFVTFCFGALTDADLPPAPYNQEAERYFQLTRAALNLEPVLERPPSVVTVQTLSLMGIYQGLVADENSIESTWALMGLSSKLAQSIGLHRDCARWKLSPAEVQKRRALFWELFITDCWQALATGRLPTFSLPFVDTELPADPDETIADDGTAQPSFPAWKARWGKECVAEIVQGTLTSRAPRYTVILDLDRKLRDMLLPKYAQGQPPQGAGLGQTMSHFMPINYLHLTLLYVHRCFFAQALTDHPTDPLRSQYAPSFLAGYRSACALLSTIREQFTLFPTQIARFWVLWTHGFSSAVMLASVVTHGGTTKTAQAALGELSLAHDLFEKAAKHGGRAVKFLPIVRRLHDKAYKAYTQGLPPKRDIFAPRVEGEQPDELSIFSGRTRTVATKSNKPARTRSVSRRRTGSGISASSTCVTSPGSTGSSAASTSGSGRNSESPSMSMPDSFPSLESYGNAVHPTLVDQMRSFQGELDEQINNAANTYYMLQEKADVYEQPQHFDGPEHDAPQQPQQQQYSQQPEGWYVAPVHVQHPNVSAPAVPFMHQHAAVSQLVPVDAQQFQPHTRQSHGHPMYNAVDTRSPAEQYYNYGVPAHAHPAADQAQSYGAHHDASQLWPVSMADSELMYAVRPTDMPATQQTYQPVQAHDHAQQQGPSMSHHHSPQEYVQMVPPPAVFPVQPGAYSLQDTWTSFMQHELPTPVPAQPNYMQR